MKMGIQLIEELLLDKSYLLNLSAPEMTVLIGGLRSLGKQLALDWLLTIRISEQ